MSKIAGLVFCIYILVVGRTCLFAQEDAPYYSVIATEADYRALSHVDISRPGSEMDVRFGCPVSPDNPNLLPVMFLNSNVYSGHYDFLRFEFPDQFAGMTVPEYFALIGRRATRQYFTGGIYAFRSQDGSLFYGFDFYMDYNDSSEQLRAEEVLPLYNQLAATFSLRPLAYIPRTPTEIANTHSWGEPPFPVYYLGEEEPLAYESYTTGTNYGRVRIMTLAELDVAQQSGSISWQDILILDAVPIDIEGVIAGVVTGQRQSELSHLAVRTGRRGTPNAYLKNARTILEPHAGKLIKLTVADNSWEVDPDVELAEAETWWDEHRPSLPSITQPDFVYTDTPSLLEMFDMETSDTLASRFGGKAAGLSRMYQVLPVENQTPGFAIPFHYFQDFMRNNTLLDTRTTPAVQRTYEEYIQALLADEQFRSDGTYRAEMLDNFRDEIEDEGVNDPQLISHLAHRIVEEFGSNAIMVRFRSSSNIEDALAFNGAGLYDSTSVCVLDSFDGDSTGPSKCDLNQPKERTIDRGLKEVWKSLWNFRAYEEREYFQIPQDQAAMAILVTTAYPDEASNGVAFTGDPELGRSAGYVINVQIGDESVVHPSVDVLPEKDVIRLNGDGSVDRILRSRPSSLMEPGTHVLSDEQLIRLAAAMHLVETELYIAREGYKADDIMLDFEFKFTQDDALIVKQVRPFLRSGATIPAQVSGWTIN